MFISRHSLTCSYQNCGARQREGGVCQPLCRGGGWTAGTRSTLVLGGTEKLLMDKESERLIGWEKKPFVCVAGEVGDAVLEDVCTRVEA